MIDPVAFQLGPFSVRWYAICVVIGLSVAVYFAMKEAPRKAIRSEDVLSFVLISFPVSLIGARIYYVGFSWSEYRQHPELIFEIWNGGIAFYGGLMAGVLVLWFFTRSRCINTLDFLSVILPSVLLAQSIGRWGNFINQEAYGGRVEHLNYLPQFIQKQMYIDGAYRQPTFLYESLWNFMGFIIIFIFRRRPNFFKRGDIVSFYLIWYGFGRLFIEGMREDSLMLGNVRVSQWLSVVLLLVGIFIAICLRRKKDAPYYQTI